MIILKRESAIGNRETANAKREKPSVLLPDQLVNSSTFREAPPAHSGGGEVIQPHVVDLTLSIFQLLISYFFFIPLY
jgi:hypothetical protein